VTRRGGDVAIIRAAGLLPKLWLMERPMRRDAAILYTGDGGARERRAGATAANGRVTVAPRGRGLPHPFVDYDVPPPWLNQPVDPMDDEGNEHISQEPGHGENVNWDYINKNLVD